MKKSIYEFLTTFAYFSLFMATYAINIDFTIELAHHQTIETLYIVSSIVFLWLLVIFTTTIISKPDSNKKTTKIIRYSSIFMLLFGASGIASWGMITSREFFLTNNLYFIMLYTSFTLILVSYIIPFGKIRYLIVIFVLTSFGTSSFWGAVNYHYPDRGVNSKIRHNMRTFQTLLEIYSTNAKGKYPETFEQLKIEAIKNGYKEDLDKIQNFFNTSDNNPIINYSSLPKNQKSNFEGLEGKIMYIPIKKNNTINYVIYAVDRYGDLVEENQKVFYLSNE